MDTRQQERTRALRGFRDRLRQLILDADGLDEHFVSAFLCHALDRIELELMDVDEGGTG